MLLNSVTAIAARCLLGLHALLAVWRASICANNSMFWLFLLVLLGVFLDLTFVIIKRRGQEWKWFSPGIFFYLATTVPCIWVLEFRRIEMKRDRIANSTSGEDESQTLHTIDPTLAKWAVHVGNQFDFNTWVNFIEQAMLFILIIVRWMMPVNKEEVSRDQLSQLLLVYLGLAADILEMLTIFEEPQVLHQGEFVIAILVIWSWSLLQFTLFLTATRSRGFSVNKVEATTENTEQEPEPACLFCDGEVWSIVIMCLMLDLPFLAVRLTAIIHYRIATYTIYFFTSKNILVVFLQGYRLSVVLATQYQAKKDKEREKFSNGSDPIPSIELHLKDK